GVVEQGATEREPLLHAAREGTGALVPGVPEPEALEQHPDPLAPLGHPVEPAVEVEVLDRGQLPVHERLMAGKADRLTRRAQVEHTRGRDGEARTEAQERRLAG